MRAPIVRSGQVAREFRVAPEPSKLAFARPLNDFFSKDKPSPPFQFVAPPSPDYDTMLSVALIARFTNIPTSDHLSFGYLTIDDTYSHPSALAIGIRGGLEGDSQESTFEAITKLWVFSKHVAEKSSRDSLLEIAKTLSLLRRGLTFDFPISQGIGISSEIYPHLEMSSRELYALGDDLLRGAMALSREDKKLSEGRARSLFSRIILHGKEATIISQLRLHAEEIKKGGLRKLHDYCGPALIMTDFLRLHMAGWSDERLGAFAKMIAQAAEKRDNIFRDLDRHLDGPNCKVQNGFNIYFLEADLPDETNAQAFYRGANLVVRQKDLGLEIWRRPSVLNRHVREWDLHGSLNTVPGIPFQGLREGTHVRIVFPNINERARLKDPINKTLMESVSKVLLLQDSSRRQ